MSFFFFLSKRYLNLGCYNEVAQTECLMNRNLFLTVLEAVSPRSWCQNVSGCRFLAVSSHGRVRVRACSEVSFKGY